MIKRSLIFLFILFWVFQNTFWSDNKLIQNNQDSPYFQIQFQRPSYILEEENTDKIIYFCDKNKKECKINFNFTKQTWKNLSSTLSCEIQTDFESKQFNRCNPNTVIFPKGIHSLSIKVVSKKNIENFSERKILIINGDFSEGEISIKKNKIEQWLSPSGFQPSPPKGENPINIITTPVYSWEAIVWKLISGEVKVKEKVKKQDTSIPILNSSLLAKRKEAAVIPEFKYIFQRPSYVLETWEKNKYICDNSKWSECKINFKLLTLEWKDISSKLECEISFSTEGFSSLKKCNPNTIIFPEWNHKVVFKIFERWNRDNFRDVIIWVENREEVKHSSKTVTKQEHNTNKPSLLNSLPQRGKEAVFSTQNQKKHFLPTTKIAIQWRVSKYKKVWYSQMTCYTYSDCSINFTSGKIYKSKREWIYFKWDFWNGIKYHWYNPKSIKFKPWFYKVKLVVADTHWNRKVEFYRLKVIELFKKTEIKKFNKQIDYLTNYETEIYKSLNKQYFKLPKNYFEKKLKKQQKLIKKINKNIGFEWFFGKKRKTKKNPQPLSGTSPFQEEEKMKKKLEKAQLKALKKAKKLKLKQEKKRIALLKKNIKLRVSLQKKNLKLSGTTLPYSKIIFHIWKQRFVTVADSKWKYELKIHSLQVWIFKITASVYKNWKLVAQKSSSEKTFSIAYISKMKNYLLKKNKKSKKKSKKYKSSTSKTKKFTIQSYLPKMSNLIDLSVFNIKIFVLNMFIAILSLILLFVILIKRKLI